MRALFTISTLGLVTFFVLGLGLNGSLRAGDSSGFSIMQIGHGHHHGRHHGHHHGSHWGHHRGHHHYHGHYRHRPSVSLRIGLGSLYGGYHNYVPFRSSYYVDPYCYGPTYYRSSYYSTYPYGIYYGATSNPRYYLPPSTQPAELAFGPQAVKQFMGVDRDFALGDLKRDDPKLVLGNAVVNRIEPKVRETNWEARRRALNFLDRGDDAFAQGKFAEAQADYDKALLNAPDMAIAYVHQAFASLASGRYQEAHHSLRQAVALEADVVGDPHFELNDLYQGNEPMKQQHLESLAEAALAAPAEGHLLVLLGAMLHYDRQVLRGEKFFQQAVKKGGAAAETAEAFLPKPKGAI